MRTGKLTRWGAQRRQEEPRDELCEFLSSLKLKSHRFETAGNLESNPESYVPELLQGGNVCHNFGVVPVKNEN